MPRDPKITPITRHEPRTFYATRVTRTQAGESWDLWSVEDGRRVGFLSVVDDGHVVYALSTVKRGTSHEEVADLVEGFFTPSSTDAHNARSSSRTMTKSPRCSSRTSGRREAGCAPLTGSPWRLAGARAPRVRRADCSLGSDDAED